MKILFAEDDRDISKAVTTLLTRNQYTVDAVYNEEDALDYLLEGDYDAAILDIMMPERSGLAVVREIRAQGLHLPVMLLTAMGELDDRVTGFDAGADDYLPKPFAGKELLARLRALLRRPESYTPSTLPFGDLLLDCSAHTLSCGDNHVTLSNKAFQVLEMMMRTPNKIISAEEFMTHIWGWDSEAEINVVFVNISTLRKQLQSLGSAVTIKALRGSGYQLQKEGCHD